MQFFLRGIRTLLVLLITKASIYDLVFVLYVNVCTCHVVITYEICAIMSCIEKLRLLQLSFSLRACSQWRTHEFRLEAIFLITGYIPLVPLPPWARHWGQWTASTTPGWIKLLYWPPVGKYEQCIDWTTGNHIWQAMSICLSHAPVCLIRCRSWSAW